MPPQLACQFTVGELAALRIVADESRQHGGCRLHLDAIAARAGVCRSTAQNALRAARRLGLITVQERRRRGMASLTNVVRIISAEWRAWLDRGEGSKK
jgi:GTP-sensing pleiotropic transcriptional regulator CodY